MNILHFGSNYLPSNGGNVIRMRMMLENNVNLKYDNVYVYTKSNPISFDDNYYYRETGIRILRYQDMKNAILELKSIVKKHKIDIVICHNLPTNLIACMILNKETIVMSEIHTLVQSSRLKMNLKKLLYKVFLNRNTSNFFVLSEYAKKFLENTYNTKSENIIFLPNGFQLNNNNNNNNNKEAKKNTNWFTFGYIGTFYSWQGIDIIYENIERILSIHPSVRVYLVGSGERYDDLLELSNLQEFKNRIIITGKVNHNEIDFHINNIDVLMIPRPSTLETETAIPLKLFEAVSYNKPLIISKVNGLTEVLSSDESFIFNPEENNGLSNVCKYIFENQLLIDGKVRKSVEKLKKWPTWNQVHRKQYKVLEDALIRKGKS